MFNPHRAATRSVLGIAVATVTIASSGSSTYARQVREPDGRASHAMAAYAKLPVAFVENRGQLESGVRYYAQGPRYAFYVTRDEVVMSFENEPATSGVALALRFPGSSPLRQVEGSRRAPGDVNYFRGSDPAGWRTGIARYAQVAYRELWPGIDMRLHEQTGTLKYEFRVRAGARPADVRLAYAGATGLSVDKTGALIIQTEMGTLRDSPPVSYQVIDGVRVAVESRYADDRRRQLEFGFTVGAGYRPDRELIIDPGVEYSTFLGGSSHELATGIKVDAAGNAYVVGTTQSPDFPTRPGAFRRTGATGNFGDVFVSKLNPTGTALVYSTFIGGSNFEWGRGIAIDAAGNAYVTGQTKSSNFPVTSRRLRQELQRRHLSALRHRSIRRVRDQAERRPARRSSTRPSSAGSISTTASRLRWTAPATPT